MQFKKILFFSFLISFLSISDGFSKIRCDLLKQLESPALKSNPSFWNEYAGLTNKGNLNDKTLETLIAKYKTLDAKTPDVTPKPSQLDSVTINKRAQKELKDLPTKAMKKNFEEFMTIMNESGIREIYKNPSRWHAEKLNGYPKGNIYTVRLSDGYRVLFKYEGKELIVMEVNAARIHAL